MWEGVTGDVQKGQRGNDRSIKEMNGSVRIKGNTESVIISRESRAAGGGEGDARVESLCDEEKKKKNHTHAGFQSGAGVT